MARVEFKNIWKRYGDNEVVKGLDLVLDDGSFIALVGPSGCGKSTILRMLAGLEEVSEGDIFIEGKNITQTVPGKRSISMVFQDYALYPHMTVFENIAFGLRIKKIEESAIREKVEAAARMTDIFDYLDRRPKELSGGQRQRVAMARAIVKDANVFLFDEPLSNLDAKLRSTMRAEIKRFHQINKTTTLYVTHDQLEAMTLSDRVVVLNAGMIEQQGGPMEVFNTPKNLFVARFIGSPEINTFEVDVIHEGPLTYVSHQRMGWKLSIPEHKSKTFKSYSKLIMGIRASDVYIPSEDDHLFDQWRVKGSVEFIELLGKNAYITFDFGDGNNGLGEVMGRELPQMGETVDIILNLNHAHFFDVESHQNISL